ncbi:MAG: L,D-transpeptidase family protein [Sulfurovum sp.]|nr:L,D-transpeptidase family protein [Sulfurovum sp.]
MIRKIILIVVMPFLWLSFSFAGKSVVIDLTSQTATAYKDGTPVFSGRVSTGTPRYPTPRGTFRILQKKTKHKSSSWPKPNGGAKMDYMQRLTRYGIAMHLGFVPNYPASHGCIRLENGFAQRMFGWTHAGMKVRIVGTPPARVYRPKRVTSYIKKQIRKKREVAKQASALDVFSASPIVTSKPVAVSNKTKVKYTKKVKKPTIYKKPTALDMLSSSPRIRSKSVASTKKVKKTKVKYTKKVKKPTIYKKPRTLDMLSTSPKAAKKIKAYQKKQWKKVPKKKSPKVDPLKAMRT